MTQAINKPVKDDWDRIMGDLPVYQLDKEEIVSKDNTGLKFTVTIIQPTSAVIEVYVEGESSPKTATFKASYDSVYSVKFKNNNNPDGLLLNAIRGKVTRDITIYATEDSSTIAERNKKFNINIVQTPNQTIGVSCNGQIKTKSFTAKEFTYYAAEISPNPGYNPGKLNITNGILTNDITITATAATKIVTSIVVNIIQSANQTITVSYTIHGKTTTHQKSFTAKPGGKIKASIASNSVAYTAGALNIVEKTLGDDDVTVKASAAQIKKFTITIQQYSYQKITVTGFGDPKTATFTNVPYNTKLKATITANSGYTAGTLNATSYTVTNNFTFKASAEATKIVNYKVSVTQSSHQTITLKRHDTNATSTTGWTNIPPGTRVTASISANSGYIAGTLNSTDRTINAAFTFSATAATPDSGYIIMRDTSGTATNGYYMVTKSFTVPSHINKVQVAFWYHWEKDEWNRLGDGNTIADTWDIIDGGEDWEGSGYFYHGWTGGEYTEEIGIWNVKNKKTWWQDRYRSTSNAVINGTTYSNHPSCIVSVTPGKTYTIKMRTQNYKGRYIGSNTTPPGQWSYCFLIIWSPAINSMTAKISDL